ncbi:CAP domain-containing protein [Thermopirellula anaerolimosa]
MPKVVPAQSPIITVSAALHQPDEARGGGGFARAKLARGWAVVLVGLAIHALSGVSAMGAESPGEKPSSRETAAFQARFRAARGDLGERRRLVEEAVARGPAVAESVLGVIERELGPQVKRYHELFYRQAVQLAGKKARRTPVEEVAGLRAAVLGLQQRPDFSGDLIRQVADPAMQRLRELLLISPDEVRASLPAIPREREKLSALGELWELCIRSLWEAAPKEERPQEPPSFDKYLLGEEMLAVGLAAPMPPATRQVLAANAQLGSRLDEQEARAVTALNLTRTLLGLSPVALDLRLCAAARDHSNDMKTLGFFSHESPVPGKATPWDRAKLFGTTASAENIAAGYPDGNAVNEGWFHSPGHHKNMLGNHKRVGVGRVGTHYTQLFGG